MKKQFIIGMILIGFMNNILIPASAAQQTMQSNLLGKKQAIVRWWQCATAPKKNKCDVQEAENARKWLLGSAAAALVIILAAAGIAGVTVRKVRQAQEERMRDEVMSKEHRIRKINGAIPVIQGNIDLYSSKNEEKAGLERKKLEGLQEEKTRLQKEIKELNIRIAIREGKLDELKRQREAVKKEVIALDEQIQAAKLQKEDTSQLKAQRAEKIKKMLELTGKIAELEERGKLHAW